MATQDPRGRRGFLIPIDLITKAKAHGFELKELQEQVRLSARCTHPQGNRRFEDIIFRVIGQRVVSIYAKDVLIETTEYYNCVTCRDSGRVQVFDQCEHCEGAGCSRCDEGLVPSTVPCPSCELNKMLSGHR